MSDTSEYYPWRSDANISMIASTRRHYHHGRAISSAVDFGMLWDSVEAKLAGAGRDLVSGDEKSFFRFNSDHIGGHV